MFNWSLGWKWYSWEFSFLLMLRYASQTSKIFLFLSAFLCQKDRSFLCMALGLPLLWQVLIDISNQYTRNPLDDESIVGLKMFMSAAASSVMSKACFAGYCVPLVMWMVSDCIHVKFTSWKYLAISHFYTSFLLSECKMRLSSLPGYCFPEHAGQVEVITHHITGCLLPNFSHIYIA